MKTFIFILMGISQLAYATGNQVWGKANGALLPSWLSGTGTAGSPVFSISPTLTTPIIGSSGPTLYNFSQNTLGWGGAFDFPGVVSAVTSNNGLMIVRMGNTDGSTAGFSGTGEGYYPTGTGYNGTGNYGVEFGNSSNVLYFGDVPMCICSCSDATYMCSISSVTTGGVTVITTDPTSDDVVNSSWNLICIGQRSAAY